jgi:PAS domain S-box-containing protein
MQIGQVLVSHIDLQDQLELIVDQAMATLDAEVAILRLLDRAGEYLQVEVARGAPDETVRQVRFRPGEGLAGRVLLSGEPLRGVNLQQDPRTSQRDLARREGWRSFVAVPICLHKQPIGAWFLIRRRRLPFSQDDLTLLSAFADCASLAVERSELFHIIVREKHASEAVIQASANGIMVVDNRGRIVDMNPALERLIDWRLREARGQPCRDILHCPAAQQPSQGDPTASCACPLHAGTRSPDRTFVEYEIQTHDGRSIPVEASYGLIRDEEGETERVVIVFRDISHEKELNRQRAEIVANVSHELRTPLALIQGYASTLLRPQVALDEAETRRFLQNVNLAAEHLGRLIDDLLYASRLDTDQLRLWPQRFNLCARVRRLLNWFRPHARDHPLLADLPDTAVWVWADPDRVDQVLVNLLTNAVKYLPGDKPVAVQVRLVGDLDTARAMVHVIDEGVGIAPQHLPHIFDRFYMTETSKKGVGLGLYICKGLVKAMGGDIWVVSELGQGSTFSFSLPTTEPIKPPDASGENNTKEPLSPLGTNANENTIRSP